ncbi:MAG: hypothetical protein H0T47_10900 [Planctomycetaceae bacterium]|nr:hypothetical protein [Planctomycetaceae bacterium]
MWRHYGWLLGGIALLAAVSLQRGIAQDAVYEEPGDEGSDTEYHEPPIVRDAASEVLSGPEFRNLPRLNLGPDGTQAEALKPKKDEKPEEVQVRTPSAGSELLSGLFGGAISLMVVGVLAVVLGAIVALIVLGIKRWERSEKAEARSDADAATNDDAEPMISPGERPADAWLAAAREAAAAGRFDEALALLLLGAMSHAERAGLIRPRRGLTYRDYLRAVPRDSAWHPTLSGLVQAYAPIGFGRREATSAAFEASVGPYERALAMEPTPRTR